MTEQTETSQEKAEIPTQSAVAQSWSERLGAAAGVAVLVGLVGAVPGALRAAAGDQAVSLPIAWLVLAGGSAALLLPLCWALRSIALDGAAAPGGAAGATGGGAAGASQALSSPLRTRLLVLLTTLLLAAPVLGVVLRVLKSATNHRPLGAATFALLAVGVTLGCLAVVSRLGAWAEAADVAPRKRASLALWALLALGALGTLYTALPLLSASSGLLDGVVLLSLSAVLAWRGIPRVSAVAGRASLGVWALLVVGCVVLGRSDAVLASLQASSPVSLGLGWVL